MSVKIRAKVLACVVALIATVGPPVPVLTAQAAAMPSEKLVITEFLADNDSVLADEDGDFEDWIEVHNPGGQAIDLGDWALTDDPLDLTQWRFPSQTLGAGEYVVVFASKKNRAIPDANLHTNFKLTSGGEYLALVEPDGQTIADEFAPAYPIQNSDVSYGRDGFFFDEPTPGVANAAPAIAPTVFDPPGSAFVNIGSVSLSVGAGRGDTIRYTTDGSAPTSSSTAYSAPIQLSATTTLRARVFDGNEGGDEVEATYIRVAQSLADRTSHLPLVIVEAFGQAIGTSAVDVTIGVIDRNGNVTRVTDPADHTGRTSMKTRGSSSLSLPKKQYKLEFETQGGDNAPADLLGFGAEHDWILYAPGAFDRSYIANPLMQRLAGDVGLTAVDQQFIELYINDGGNLTANDYEGIYVLSESIKIDTNRVDVSKLDANDNEEPQVTGGYLLSVDRQDSNEYSFDVPSNLRPNNDFNVVGPKNDRLTGAQRSWIQTRMGQIDQVLSSNNFANVDSGYRAYIDTQSVIDTHLLEVIAKDPDMLRLSNYLHLDREGKLRDDPIWDFDRSLNSADSRDDNPNQFAFVGGGGEVDPSQYAWWGRMFGDERFRWEYAGRWTELRNGPLSNAAIFAAIDDLAGEVQPAYAREIARWQSAGRYGSRYGDFDGEISALKNWLGQRLSFLDGWVDDLPQGANQIPDVVDPSDRESWVGDPVQFQVEGADPEFQTLTWTAGGLPNGLLIDSQTGLITGSPTTTQNRTVTVTATDSVGGSRSRSFAWSIIDPPDAPILLNEWNAVGSSDVLPGGDSFFGQVPGNGGDWFELIVLEDELDLRGWTLELSEDRAGLREVTDRLVFADRSVLSGLRAGTIITVSEDRADDVSFDPASGDWWINLRAADGGAGGYFTSAQANFDTSADDWQLVIRDAAGTKRFGPAGEGVGSLPSGVTSTEIGELEQDPNAAVNVEALYDDGDDSTFGALNTFDGASQDASALRAWFNEPPVIESVQSQASRVGAAYSLAPAASDPEGDPFTWSAEGLPNGLDIDQASGEITGVPTQAGSFDIVVSAADAQNESNISFDLVVAPNDAPVIVAVDDRTDLVGEEVTVDMAATDTEDDPIVWSAASLPDGLSIDSDTGRISGSPVDVQIETVVVTASDPWGESSTDLVWTIDRRPVEPRVICGDALATLEVVLFNTTGAFASYSVTVDGTSRSRSMSARITSIDVRDGFLDGPVSVSVTEGGATIFDEVVNVDCGNAEPTPIPVPTATPAPTPAATPTATPVPAPVQAVDAVVTCLAGNGRVDINIVNTGDADALYRVEFEGLSPREAMVAADDWRRFPLTGRPDRDFDLVVRRDGIAVLDTTLTFSCDGPEPVIEASEVQVVNACRGGNGYLLFQLANATDATRGWVIEFDGVPNRSTSAAAWGASVRAVTGRPDGTYEARVRVGSTRVATLSVTVDCD